VRNSCDELGALLVERGLDGLGLADCTCQQSNWECRCIVTY
jgi:hypothetical protein